MRASRARMVVPVLGAVLSAAALSAAIAGPAAASGTGSGSSPITIPLPSPLPQLTLPPIVSLTSPASGAPQINLPTETRTVPQMQAALLADLNSERAAAGLGSLTTQPWAESVAMAHSADMAAARDIWHNYSGFVDLAHQTVNAYVNGENVGMAYTLDEADAALMASPTHRSNILYPLFNEVGIGIARDSIGYVYVTEDFVDIRAAGAPPPPAAHATTASHPAAAATTTPTPAAPTPTPPPATPAPDATPIVAPATPGASAPKAGSGGRPGQPLAAGRAVLTARRTGIPWPVAALGALAVLLAAGLGRAAQRRSHGRHQA
ncbi:MAG TPA: CAP domain-containing protein [Actinomycetota bacterium]|nr:CAP domain-containing protein [Actinomycetota bacterium]